MGYADGYYYGQGRIICDTSTFSVGDTIRVRSMTDSSKVWNQQVATVGTALVFTVPPYDYYKICTVQTIDDTPTEIGGVYKTVDYGQTIFVDNMFDKSTLRGIQGILDSHQENDLSIGDTVFIKIQGGNDWECQVGAINPYTQHEVILVSKYLYDSTFTFQSNHTNKRNTENAFYNLISADDKALLKNKQVDGGTYPNGSTSLGYTTKIFCPTYYELMGASSNPPQSSYETENNVQWAIFTTSSNRIKFVNGGSAQIYATSSNAISWADIQVIYMQTTGVNGYNSAVSNCRILPCFRLTADS